MDKTTLLQADYLDIIFYLRNKNYGGYELRRHYSQRLGRALLSLLAAVSLLICCSLLAMNRKADAAVFHGLEKPVIFSHFDKPPVVPPAPIRARPVPPPSPVKMVIHTEPVITDAPIKPAQQMTENKDLAGAQPGPATGVGDPAGLAPATGNGPASTGSAAPAEVSATPFIIVSQMPQFNGDMQEFLGSHVHYPQAAKDAGIDGMVVVRFVVNEDGSVSDATVVRGIGGGCDEEAMRVVLSMPKWKPGKQNGAPVKVYFTLPIKFVLN